MAIHFNHTIVSAHDSKASATFLAEMLNLAARNAGGHFRSSSPRTEPISITWTLTAKSRRSITPFWSAKPNSTRFSAGFGIEILPAGPIPGGSSRARSITTTADAVSTSRTPTVTSSKSSPARTAAADGIRKACGAIRRFVARMERSEIRDYLSADGLIPDCAALHPGYGSPRHCERSDELQSSAGFERRFI